MLTRSACGYQGSSQQWYVVAGINTRSDGTLFYPCGMYFRQDREGHGP
jgi:hypothetical protein